VGSFRYRVYHCYDGVISGRFRKFHDEVHVEGIPPSIQYREWVQFSDREVSHHLCLETEVTDADILSDIPRHLGPLVVAGHQL